jgi:hypothetical protein
LKFNSQLIQCWIIKLKTNQLKYDKKKLDLICQTWIIRPQQPHRNKIKTNYEAQFLINPTLKDETEKN